MTGRRLATAVAALGAAVLSMHVPAAHTPQTQPAPIAVPEPAGDAGAVSPDGRYLVFRSDSEKVERRDRLRDLAIWEIATGQSRTVVAHTENERIGPNNPAVWSPDSKRLAYAWCDGIPNQGDLFCDVRVIGVDGNAPRTIVPRTKARILLKHWSPDGRAILAEIWQGENRRIVLIDETRGEFRDLPIARQDSDDDIDLRSTALSPDSRFLAYTRSRWQDTPYDAYLDGDIYVVDLKDGEERLVMAGPVSDVFTAWSRDGKQMLFTSDRSGTTDLWRAAVNEGRVSGTPMVIRRRTGAVVGVTASNSGALFFRTPYEESSEIETVSIDPATAKVLAAPRPVSADSTRRRSRPAWSSDGKSLLYRSGPARPVPSFATDGYNAVTVQSMASGETRTVTLNHKCVNDWHGWSVAPDSSPDRWILSIEGSIAACRGLYSIDRDTGAVSAILSGPQYSQRAVPLQTGNSMIFIRSQTVVIRDSGGSERVVVDLRSPSSGFEGGSFGDLAMSHTGDRAAVAVSTRDGQRHLGELNLANGGIRAIPGLKLPRGRGWGGLAWTGDDRHLLYTAEPGTPGDVWRVPIEGGTPAPIGLLSSDSTDLIWFFSVSPDGRTLAFERHRTNQPALFVLNDVLTAGAGK